MTYQEGSRLGVRKAFPCARPDFFLFMLDFSQIYAIIKFIIHSQALKVIVCKACGFLDL